MVTAPKTTDSSSKDLEALACEYVRLAADLETLRDRQQLVAEKLRNLGVGKHALGSVSIGVQRNRRLSLERVQAEYPVASFPHLYRPALDVAALRQHVTENDLDGFYVEGTPKVVVRP